MLICKALWEEAHDVQPCMMDKQEHVFWLQCSFPASQWAARVGHCSRVEHTLLSSEIRQASVGGIPRDLTEMVNPILKKGCLNTVGVIAYRYLGMYCKYQVNKPFSFLASYSVS